MKRLFLNLMITGTVIFFNQTQVNAKPKMGTCHACVDVTGTSRTCQTYKCPKEGANGNCVGVDCNRTTPSQSKDVTEVTTKSETNPIKTDNP